MDNKTEKKSWFDRLFSLDEMKTSSLVLCLLASLGFGIFFCFDKGDIPNNLEVIILALVGGISGVSAFNLMSGRNGNQFGNQYYDPNSSQYSQYGMNQYQQPYQQSQYNPMTTTTNTFTESPMTNPTNQVTLNNQMENESDPASRGI
jgi:hypothetical protein